MASFRLRTRPFTDAVLLRRWRQYWRDDASATPFQSPEFHRLYAEHTGTASALLDSGSALLPLSSRPIGFGLRAGELSPNGQYGGPVGGPSDEKSALLQYAEGAGLLEEGLLAPAARHRFLKPAHLSLRETTVLYRGPEGWGAFRPTRYRRRFQGSGSTVVSFGQGRAPASLYGLHVAQHARWGTPPMSRGLHNGLLSLPRARAYVCFDRDGDVLAYLLRHVHGHTAYYARGVTTAEGRRLDAHRVLHEAVLRDLPPEINAYDLGSSMGLAPLKAFKLRIGGVDVPLLHYRRHTLSAKLRAGLGHVGQVLRRTGLR